MLRDLTAYGHGVHEQRKRVGSKREMRCGDGDIDAGVVASAGLFYPSTNDEDQNIRRAFYDEGRGFLLKT